jgi:chitinase
MKNSSAFLAIFFSPIFLGCVSQQGKTSATATDGTARADSLQAVNVTWTGLVNATASGATLTKSAGAAGVDDAGGNSAQTIASGDGYLQFGVTDTQSFRFVGLGKSHGGVDGNAIDFAFRMQAGRADAYEDGAWKADNTVVQGDVLKVSVESGVVKLYKNGTVFYTSATKPTYPLVAYGALIDTGATVANAQLGLAAATPTPTPSTGGFLSAVAAAPTSDGTGATITWTSAVAADAQVHYGTSTSYDTWSVYAGTAATSHSIALSGLTAGTKYHFSVRSVDAAGDTVDSGDNSFTTATAGGGTTTAAAAHHFCGWLLATGYQTPDQDPGYMDFAANASQFDAVHPMWYSIATYNTFNTIYGVNAPNILSNTTAGGKKTLLIPTIAGADSTQPTILSTMLHDNTQRATHEAAIVSLVTSNKYDGIDLDYEHLPDTDRAAFSQFAGELATQLHAAGKTLSFAVGGETSAATYWDYDALSQVADQLHVMAYDYHFLGSHEGPVAPLGWVQNIVTYIDAIGRPQKFILGLPNYGLAGTAGGNTTWFGTSADAIAMAGAGYATTTTHMSTCPFAAGEAIAPGRAPNVPTSSQGTLYFDDLASMQEKVEAAQAGKLGGITYWTIGGEPTVPGTQTFFQMIRGYYPQQ